MALSWEMLLHPTGGPLRVAVGYPLLGRHPVPSGRLNKRLAPSPQFVGVGVKLRTIDAPEPDYRQCA